MERNPPPAPPAKLAAGSARMRRRLLRLAEAAGIIVLLAVAFVLAILFTEWGARIAWQTASRLLPGQLTGEVAGGTLAAGLELRNVVYADKSKRVHIDHLESAWTFSVSPPLLTVHYLRLGQVELTQRPSPPEPSAPPAEIMLPMAIDLQRATVEQLTIHNEGAAHTFRALLLHAESDGVRHRLVLERVDTPVGQASASVRLDGSPPFALSGTVELDSVWQGKSFALAAQLSGTLREPGIHLNAAGAGLTAQADIDATPFAPVPLRHATIRIRNADPKAFNRDWPQADLDVNAELAPVGGAPGLTVSGPVSLANDAPGPLDRGLLPVVAAHAQVVLDAQRQRLSGLTITLAGDASLAGSGELRGPNEGELALQVDGIDMHALHTGLRKSHLAGPLRVTLAGDTQQFSLQLADDAFSVAADATLAPGQITLAGARLEAGNAVLEAHGTLGREGESPYEFAGTLSDFNPALFFADAPRRDLGWQAPDARINMQFTAEGTLRPVLRTVVDFRIRDSTYAGLPMTGGGTVRVADREILPSNARLSIAGNRIALKGSFGQPADRLRVDIDAPALGRLGFGLSGLLRVEATLAGALDRPDINASFRAENLAYGPHRIAALSGEARMQGLPGAAPDAPIMLELEASGVQSADARLSRITADIEGTYARHTIDAAASGRLRDHPLTARLAARGGLRARSAGMAWDGVLNTLENEGFPRVSLLAPMSLQLAPGAIELGATRLEFEGADVSLQGFRYAEGVVRTEGAFRALEIAPLLELRRQLTGNAPLFDTDLVLDGRWDLALAERAAGVARIERRSGDISLPPGEGGSAIGLSALSARAELGGTQLALEAHAAAARIGTVDARAQISLQPSGERLSIASDAPVSGHVEAAIPRLQALGLLSGPGLAFEGRAAAAIDIGGTLANPRLSGTATGDDLAVMMYDQGIRMHDGTARLVLKDSIVEIQRLEFQSGGGTLRATGRLSIDRTAEPLRATITADNFLLLSNPAAQLILSGQAQVSTVDQQLLVTGRFVVDRALFDLPEKTPPELGDDVVVVRGGQPVDRSRKKDGMPVGAFSPKIDIQVDLGDDFRFEGAGAELRLAGTLDIRSAPSEPPQAFGTIRVVEGTYEAFGVELAIERGVINFQGPFNNPSVNILAMRREQEVAAGVRVSGTAQQPRVQLVSDPDVSDEEKLSWLVFGSGGAGGASAGQAQASAKGAALGLLNKFGAERLGSELGLDELAIGESEFGLAGQQVINLGKEISDRLYIGYEQSLAGAENILKLTYELTRNWSVVLLGGEVTGIEVLFSKRFDSLR